MINVTSVGFDKIERSFTSLYQGLSDFSPFMELVGKQLSQNTAERFYTKTDPEGVKWAELAPSTVQRKGHNKILIDTGTMMDSITYDADAKSAMIYSKDDQDKVRHHQYGEGNMPKRAIFGLSLGEAEEIEKQAIIWAEGLL